MFLSIAWLPFIPTWAGGGHNSALWGKILSIKKAKFEHEMDGNIPKPHHPPMILLQSQIWLFVKTSLTDIFNLKPSRDGPYVTSFDCKYEYLNSDTMRPKVYSTRTMVYEHRSVNCFFQTRQQWSVFNSRSLFTIMEFWIFTAWGGNTESYVIHTGKVTSAFFE